MEGERGNNGEGRFIRREDRLEENKNGSNYFIVGSRVKKV